VTGLASVQTPADAAPLTWSYFLGALALAAIIAGGLLLMAYLDSDQHRARMARVRRMSRRNR
jgi:uncharacterized integral membrane protein